MPETVPKPSLTFTVAIFVVAAAVGIAIIWLGMTGHIGGPIP